MKALTALNLLYRRFARNDAYAGYVLAEKATKILHPEYRFSDFQRLWLRDQKFLSTYRELLGEDNYHSADRKYFLRSLCSLVAGVEGDVAECGSHRGTSAWFLARELVPLGKELHLFDSFQGLSEPGPLDGSHWRAGDLRSAESVCRDNLAEFGEAVRFFPGWIPTRFDDVATRRYCYVHLDLDLYGPTRESISFFYPRLSPSGLMVFDDYGFPTCPGATAAVDEFFAHTSEQLVIVPTGQAFVMRSSEAAAFSDQ